jgi:hypothetical protein
MNSIKKFISYYNPYKHLFFSDMFCALTLSGIDLLFPLVVRYLLNDVYIMEDRGRILHYVLIIGSVLLYYI